MKKDGEWKVGMGYCGLGNTAYGPQASGPQFTTKNTFCILKTSAKRVLSAFMESGPQFNYTQRVSQI